VFGALNGRPEYREDLRDGLHPGAAGYAMIADLVDAWPVWRALLAGR
jgi:lysophospholipase L1-like esterase